MKHTAEADRRYVGMGEVKTGKRCELLQATLGSCIGIGLVWKKGGRCGLAHCLLPEAPEPRIRVGARYVSQAVPSLLLLMGLQPSDYADLEVIIAGGARMFRSRPSVAHVGELNVQAVRKYLALHGLTVSHEDVGGRRGRQMMIDCSRHAFVIKEIAHQPEELHDECT